MIITKPRQLRIDLDPDKGFPVGMQLEQRRIVIEDGQELMELPVEVISIDPKSELAQVVIGEITANAVSALKTYQDEVQRLAAQLLALEAEPADTSVSPT